MCRFVSSVTLFVLKAHEPWPSFVVKSSKSVIKPHHQHISWVLMFIVVVNAFKIYMKFSFFQHYMGMYII